MPSLEEEEEEEDKVPHAVRVEIWQDGTLGQGGEPEISYAAELVQGSMLPLQLAANAVLQQDETSHDTKTKKKSTSEQADHGVNLRTGTCSGFVSADVDAETPRRPGVGTITGSIEDPLLWTAECPNLYTLVITLYRNIGDAEADRHDIHTVSHRIGFRSVTIGGPDNNLRINDTPITVCGINRHEFSTAGGRAVTKASMFEDAVQLKKLNFNAVRSAHYPQHPYWLEVCDEVGLYVIDEANIETHGFQVLGQPVGYLAARSDWRGAIAARITRMLERDKNHACVIGWSLGNECGHGPTHDLMAQWLRTRDPGRFVQYESGGARTAATDIICPMYLRPQWCEEQTRRDLQRRPVILCEYAHAMGNSGGCLEHYWKAFWDPKLPRMQGGFIWDFADQGLTLPNGGFGYGGDFGDYPNTKQFCCNGIVAPNRVPYPSAFQAAHLQAPLEITLFFNNTNRPPSSSPGSGNRKTCAIPLPSELPEATLIVCSRRAFSDLSNLVITVTPYAHGSTLHNWRRYEPFDVPCGRILPRTFQKFPIHTLLAESMSTCYRSEVMDCLEQERGLHLASEFWLDISVTARPYSMPDTASASAGVSSPPVITTLRSSQHHKYMFWCRSEEKGFEILHASLSNRLLKHTMESLQNSLPAQTIHSFAATRGKNSTTTTTTNTAIVTSAARSSTCAVVDIIGSRARVCVLQE
mmetsp:Transcript_9478/g.15719  ORF Transcript_9478/g.15719 Transcript_9478/m.15719 type:complete len:696 (+) Transcript_9478:1656-3743(+)